MACELLDFTDLTASDIGSALVYASPSVFADAFRRWTDSSPLAFRRRNVPLRPASAQA